MVLEQFAHIKVLFLDVDGVLTDGSVLVTERGEQLRRFSVKDGYAMQLAIKRGLHVAIISGGNSAGVEARLRGLGVKEIHLAVADKQAVLDKLVEQYGVSLDQVAFMGDDIPDLVCMKKVGLAICPLDAVEEVKAAAHYVSPKKGGEGCVREVLEKMLKLQGKWYDAEQLKSI